METATTKTKTWVSYFNSVALTFVVYLFNMLTITNSYCVSILFKQINQSAIRGSVRLIR
jgi:hypothetical protein